MEFLLNRYRNMTVLLLAILAQLVLLAWQVKSSQDVRLIRVWSVTAVTPLARVLEFVREHTIGAVQNYVFVLNVRSENERLRDELGRIRMENQFLRNELATAERVRALQEFQQRTPSRTLPARIIGTGTGTNSRVVFIDQGSAKGVMRGMAVVTPEGIVGKVLAAYPTASQVLLITDETFAAGVISEKNRVQGTVKGMGQSKVAVEYVQNEEKVEPSEMFYTSGDDRIFPKGMPVGRVTVVRPGNPFKEILLVPEGFQQGLEEVLVVLEGVHGDMPASGSPASSDVYIMPPVEPAKPAPPSTSSGTPAPSGTSGDDAVVPPSLTTDADRLRERYKRIGEAQKHPYGQPGRVPDFNLNPDASSRPTPAAPRAGTQSTGPQVSSPATGANASAARPQTTAPVPETQRGTGTESRLPAGGQAPRVPASTGGTVNTPPAGPQTTPPKPRADGSPAVRVSPQAPASRQDGTTRPSGTQPAPAPRPQQ